MTVPLGRSLRQRIEAGFASAVLVLVVGVIAWIAVRAAESATQQVEHTREVTVTLDAVLAHLQDAQTAQRGYLLTGERVHLEPYRVGVEKVGRDLAALRRLLVNNPAQRANLDELEPAVHSVLSVLDSTIALRQRPNGLSAAVQVVRVGRGTRRMNTVRQRIDGMRTTESRVLAIRQSRADELRRFSTTVIVGGSFLAFVLAVLANRGIRAAVMERERQRERLEAQTALLAAQRVELERSNRELDQFAYVASHDLKAPLRGIGNLSAWLEEDLSDALTGEAHEHMSLLRGRVQRMERLIDGILEYSRAGRLHAQPEHVEVDALVGEVVELLAPPSTVSLRVAPDLPTLETERVPLQQVFMNLIANAVKHAHRDDARVDVSAQQRDGVWEFVVADNGPGIAPEYHERVFGIFQTLEARDHVEGTGIGLSVVKKLVEARGGRVWIESAAGTGAAFHFTWP